jgi:hypothetical protein
MLHTNGIQLVFAIICEGYFRFVEDLIEVTIRDPLADVHGYRLDPIFFIVHEPVGRKIAIRPVRNDPKRFSDRFYFRRMVIIFGTADKQPAKETAY